MPAAHQPGRLAGWILGLPLGFGTFFGWFYGLWEKMTRVVKRRQSLTTHERAGIKGAPRRGGRFVPQHRPTTKTGAHLRRNVRHTIIPGARAGAAKKGIWQRIRRR